MCVGISCAAAAGAPFNMWCHGWNLGVLKCPKGEKYLAGNTASRIVHATSLTWGNILWLVLNDA